MLNIAVSACLLGETCRYDGKSKSNSAVTKLGDIQEIRIIPICPEAEGGLKTPRLPAEIQNYAPDAPAEKRLLQRESDWGNGKRIMCDIVQNATGKEGSPALLNDDGQKKSAQNGASRLGSAAKSGNALSRDDAFRFVNSEGYDVTNAFKEGAHASVERAQEMGARLAILKTKSPSCGSGEIYDGTFSGKLILGWGVAAELFKCAGIPVISEKEVEQLSALAAKTAGTNWEKALRRLLEQIAAGEPDVTAKASASAVQTQESLGDKDRGLGLEELQTFPDNSCRAAEKKQLPPITLKKFLGHFRTITKHKIEVGKLCFKVGLIKQGLTHDLSKYSPTEFLKGARFYQGYRSPNAAEREFKGYTEAWLHHKGRNKHHFEYWLDLSDDPGMRLKPAPMPLRYVVEMFCDRIAASKTYKGAAYQNSDPWEYYKRGSAYIIMHPETRATLEKLLTTLSEKGEDAALSQARGFLHENRRV